MPTIKRNAQTMRDQMTAGVQDILAHIIEGGAEDLAQDAAMIGARLARAASLGRPDVVQECRIQLEALTDINRHRLGEGLEDTVNLVIRVGVEALVRGAMGALASTTVIP